MDSLSDQGQLTLDNLDGLAKGQRSFAGAASVLHRAGALRA